MKRHGKTGIPSSNQVSGENRNSQQNMGFTLVEVLVTMMVIALVSVPIIRAFVVTANVNLRARRTQNATDVAQNVSEYFSALSLEQLKATYTYGEDPDTGTLVFENIGDGVHVDDEGISYYNGQESEKFYVTVVLNPTEYSSLDGDGINDYIVPSLENLYGQENVTAFSQFTKYDNRIRNAFLVNKGIQAEYSDIKKTSTIHIQETPSGDNLDYTYYLTVTYTYCTHNGSDYVETSDSISYEFTLGTGTLSATEQAPDLYMVYGAFDIYDSNHISSFARDEIHILYQESGVQATDRPVNVFLIQQDVKHAWDSFKTVGIDPDNVFVSSYHRVSMGGVMDYTNNENTMVTLRSNIEGWPADLGLTVGTESMTTLYTMDVYIRYDEKDSNDPMQYFTETGADLSDIFTSVSTVKEE